MWYPSPLVGRGEQLGAVRTVLVDGSAHGVVIVGGPGVGKSRLAAEAVAGLDPATFRVARVQATLAGSTLPYGSLSHLLSGSGVLASRPGTLVLAIDDAQWLDHASAELVRETVTAGAARIVATVRAGEDVPPPVERLWRDGIVRRLELGPLPENAAARMLADLVHGQVEAATARCLCRLTGGNPLFLREIVLAGALTEVDGVWRRTAGLPVVPRLSELVGDRIGEIDEEERRLLEYVAFGEPVGVDVVAGLTSRAAVDRLVRRQIVTVVVEGRRRFVRLAHPIYGEVIRGRTGGVRGRLRLRRLAEAAEATGLRRRDDVLRVAAWWLDAGGGAGPAPLLAACRIAWAAHDLDLALRLARAAVEAGGGAEAEIVLGDLLRVAGRAAEAVAVLGRAADVVTGDRARALVAIARARALHDGLGRAAEARQVLDAAEAAIVEPGWRQEIRTAAAACQVIAGNVDGAPALADRVRAMGRPAARVSARLAAVEAQAYALTGRTERALATAGAALATAPDWRDEIPDAYAELGLARVLACVIAGDLGRAEEIVAAGYRALGDSDDWNLAAAVIAAGRALIHRLRGEPATAIHWCRAATARTGDGYGFAAPILDEHTHGAAQTGDARHGHTAPVPDEDTHTAARSGGARHGYTAPSLDEHTYATARTGDARHDFTAPIFDEHTHGAARSGDVRHGFTAPVFGELAHAAALVGEVDVAAGALAEAERRAGPATCVMHFPAVLARAWIPAARGDVGRAVELALDGAAMARGHGLAAFEMFALHDVVRLGAADRTDGRLAALARRVDGTLAPLFARHAAAIGDGAELAAVGAEYERLGMPLYAAEATAQAARVRERTGRSRSARELAARAWAIARRCQGARTPALAAMATPELTARQRQIIHLVVIGSSNREIAGSLGLSVRTVENHLLRAYERLGVGDRAELADLFAPQSRPPAVQEA